MCSWPPPHPRQTVNGERLTHLTLLRTAVSAEFGDSIVMPLPPAIVDIPSGVAL